MSDVNIGIVLNSFVKTAPWWIYPPLVFLYIFHNWYPKQEKKVCDYIYKHLTKNFGHCDRNIQQLNKKLESLEKDIQEIINILTNKK